MWERRTAIVSTSYSIGQGDVADTFEIAEMLLEDEHDLIQRPQEGGCARPEGRTARDR